MGVFDAAVCTIFAREVLEGTLIIGQYRTVIKKSPDFADETKQKEALRAVTVSASIASAFAFVLILAVAIPLGIVGKQFDKNVGYAIEGISKVVAAICILQLSTKCPKWLGYYASKKITDGRLVEGLSIRSIKFNVAWNIWREVGEIGVFLLPFFLGDDSLIEIPVSAIIGIVVGLVSGLGVYYASANLDDKFWLTFFLSAVTGMLSVGLFVGGCHEFEVVWGSTKTVWTLEGNFWDHNRLPMTIIKPFGYSSTRTVLQICCFWSWFAFLLACHYYKYKTSQIIFAKRRMEKELEMQRVRENGEKVKECPDEAHDNVEPSEQTSDSNEDKV